MMWKTIPFTVLLMAMAGCATETDTGSPGSDVDGKADSYGENVSCTIDTGETGVCMDMQECDSVAGTRYQGYCPGASNIQCCIQVFSPDSACRQAGGVCIPQEEYTTCAQDYDLATVEYDLSCDGPVDGLCCMLADRISDMELGDTGGIEEVLVYGLDPYIHPELGFWLVDQPGVYPSLHHFYTLGEMYEFLDANEFVHEMMSTGCQNINVADSGFSCDNEESVTYPFTFSGCTYEDIIGDQLYLDRFMQMLEDYDLVDFSEEEEWLAAEISDMITHQVTLTDFQASLGFYVDNQSTFLMVIDLYSFSCDA